MKLIVGLRNPGKEYVNTRHNLGAILLEKYVDGNWEEKSKLSADIIKNGDIVFAKSLTYMNESGIAVAKIVDYFDIEKILVVFDDVSLDLGKYRLTTGKSGSTHNGVRDIIKAFDNVDRLKIGIKPDHPVTNLSNFVLGNLTKNEIDQIPWDGLKNDLENWIKNN